MLFRVLKQRQHVQTIGIVQAACMVLNGDNLGPGFVKQPGGCAAHVAEALYDYPGAFDGNTGIARSFATHHIDTTAGCFDTAQARTDARREGKGWVSTCRSGWSPDPK